MGYHHEPLKFIASPLRHVEHSEKGEQTPLGGSEQLLNKTNTDAEVLPFQNNDGELHDTPEFHRHEEATTSELFYDLFFVANLTTFTSLLEINDHKCMSYFPHIPPNHIYTNPISSTVRICWFFLYLVVHLVPSLPLRRALLDRQHF